MRSTIVFDEFTNKDRVFEINGRRHGLLLVIEVFRSEMEWAMDKCGNKFLELMRKAGCYPYSDLDRKPVVQ